MNQITQLQVFGFVGLGLIGGSLARAIRRCRPDCQIMAYNRTRETLRQAREDGVIDWICGSLSDRAFSSCDIIFLCAPVDSNVEALGILRDTARPDCILTDVGSVKTDIHLAAEDLGLSDRFIGGHPMTGSEKSGYGHSAAHLFENSYYILTPTSRSDPDQLEAYRTLVQEIGALPIVLDYRRHDFATAAVSHLPHLIAAALVNTVHSLDDREELMKMLAAGGFKDITRIASSSPEMWEGICLENSANIGRVMDTFLALLQDSRKAMEKGDGTAIHDMFRESRDYRNSFNNAAHGYINRSWRIYCDLVDEAGAIATIATILAVGRISIRNIRIVHNREFEEGVLEIEFYGEEARDQAVKILDHHRYQVWVR